MVFARGRVRNREQNTRDYQEAAGSPFLPRENAPEDQTCHAAARRAEAAQLDQLTIRQRLAHELNERKAAIPGMLDALVAKAQKGSVPAARELRGWYDQGLGRPEATLDKGDVDTPYQHDPRGARTLARRTDQENYSSRGRRGRGGH